MKCLRCQENEAIISPNLGYIYCKDCQKGKRLGLPQEFVPQSVKDSRKEYAKDIIQSYRDGVLSKERLDAYGTNGLKVTQEEIDNAQYVWNDIKPYNEGVPKNI